MFFKRVVVPAVHVSGAEEFGGGGRRFSSVQLLRRHQEITLGEIVAGMTRLWSQKHISRKKHDPQAA